MYIHGTVNITIIISSIRTLFQYLNQGNVSLPEIFLIGWNEIMIYCKTCMFSLPNTSFPKCVLFASVRSIVLST